jgi:hypothetical protein
MIVFPEEGDIPALNLLHITNTYTRGSFARLPLVFFYGNYCNKRLFFILLPTVLNHLSLENISVISYIIHKLYGQAILLISPNGTIQPWGRQGVSQ